MTSMELVHGTVWNLYIDIFLCMLDSDLFFANHIFYVTKKLILTWCIKLSFYKRAKCALVYNCKTTCMQISQRRNTFSRMLCNGFNNNSRSYKILFKFFECAFWTSSKLLLQTYNTNFSAASFTKQMHLPVIIYSTSCMRKCVTTVSLTALGNLFLFVYRNVIFFIYKSFSEFLYSSLYKSSMHSFRRTLVAHKLLIVIMSLIASRKFLAVNQLEGSFCGYFFPIINSKQILEQSLFVNHPLSNFSSWYYIMFYG